MPIKPNFGWNFEWSKMFQLARLGKKLEHWQNCIPLNDNNESVLKRDLHQNNLQDREERHFCILTMIKPFYSFCQWGAVIFCIAKPKRIQFSCQQSQRIYYPLDCKLPKSSKGIVVHIVSLGYVIFVHGFSHIHCCYSNYWRKHCYRKKQCYWRKSLNQSWILHGVCCFF